MPMVVLIDGVRFDVVNIVADILTRITGEEISVSHKHLDQNDNHSALIQINRLAQSL